MAAKSKFRFALNICISLSMIGAPMTQALGQDSTDGERSKSALDQALEEASQQNEGTTTDTPPIVIKPLPTRPNSTAAPRPTAPRVRPASAKAGTMSGVEESMIPGITCPLIENRPHADLLAAIENLNRYVKTTPNCKDNGDAQRMAEVAQGLKTSGAALQGYWTNPAVLTENPAALADFQKQLETMVVGINSVGETLANSSLLKSECGKELTSKASILVAFSDLATSLAPIALLGASINPSWSIGLKVILGVIGAGSVAKIFSVMHDEGTLDMSLPENRVALLQNTCEFSKIAQRVRFLKLAQSGQIDQVTQEIRMYKSRTDNQLQMHMTEHVLGMVDFRNQVVSVLDGIKATIEKDSISAKTATARVSTKDDNLACIFAQDLIDRVDNENSFPGRPIANLKSLIENQAEVSLDQSFLLRSEQILRNKLRANNSSSSADDIARCAADGRSYVTNLNNIIAQTQLTVNSHRSSLHQQLSKDQAYAKYRQAEMLAYKEIETLTKIGSILERLNQDNSVIDKSEMHQQMAALKRSLFTADSWYKSSPVQAWLSHSNKMFAEALGRFNKELAGLMAGSGEITKSGNRIPLPPRSDSVPQYYKDQVSQYLKDNTTVQGLANINLQTAPVGSPQHADICRRLESTWLEWASALDHLAAQDFFCKNISSLMDQSVEKSIVNHCYGHRDFAGKVIKKSLIAELQEKLASNGAKSKALLVSSKLKALKCEMPDALASMQ